MSPAADLYRLRAFEVDWIGPLLRDAADPVSSVLLAEARAWLQLGERAEYFPPARSLQGLPRIVNADLRRHFEGFEPALIGPHAFAQHLCAAQDDLTRERREFLRLLFFSSDGTWKAHIDDLWSFVAKVVYGEDQRTLADALEAVDWGLTGAESSMEGDASLPASWRSATPNIVTASSETTQVRLEMLNEARQALQINLLRMGEHQQADAVTGSTPETDLVAPAPAAARAPDQPAGQPEQPTRQRQPGSATAKIVLQMIREHPGITIGELADKLGVRQIALYAVLGSLADKGLVEHWRSGWRGSKR